MTKRYQFQSKIVLYPGMGGWHFAGVPKDHSQQIKTAVKVKAGFGSVPVTVRINKTIWETSIFPDSKSGCYLLPIKASVRKKEGIMADDKLNISITLRA